jgi:hypothetical protein
MAGNSGCDRFIAKIAVSPLLTYRAAMRAVSACNSHRGPTDRELVSTANVTITNTAVADDGDVNDCDQ